MKTAIELCFLLQALEKKYNAAKEDGTVSRDEIVDLVVSFFAGLVDILSGILPAEFVEAAVDNSNAIRDRVAELRGKAATALDEASEKYDQIIGS